MRTEDHNSSPKSVLSLRELEQSFVFVKFISGNTIFRQTLLKGILFKDDVFWQDCIASATGEGNMNAPRWCNDTGREEQKYSKKITVPTVTLSTTNPTWTCLQLKPDLIGESFVVWGGHTYESYFSEFLEILSWRGMLGRRHGYELFLP